MPKTPSIIPLLAPDMFPDAMSARPILTRDGRGKPLTWGSSISVPCKLTGNDQGVTFKKDGIEYKPSVIAVCQGLFGLTTEWEFTLPSGYKPNMPIPVDVSTASDENGAHHQTVYFS